MASQCGDDNAMNTEEGDRIDMDDEPEIIKEILSDNTKDKLSEIKKNEGNVLYKQGKYKDALPFYSEAISLSPDNVTLFLNRAACYLMNNDPRSALQDCQEALRLEPNSLKALARECKCHVALGDASSAARALNRIASLDPGNADLATETKTVENLQTFITEGDKAYAKADFRKCVYCMDRALKLSPGCVRFKLLRAECCAFLKRLVEARDVVSDIIRFEASNADAIYVRGLVLYYEDQIDKAFQHFQKVLRLAPDHSKALKAFKLSKSLRTQKDLGNETFKKEDYQKAYTIYSGALEIDPLNNLTNAKLHFNRAQCCVKLQRVNEAVEDCTKAIQLDPSYQKAYIRRAKCYQDLEMFEEAVQDFELVYQKDRTKENKRFLETAKMELKKSKRKDYYKILGVSKTASEDEIKKAYKKKALVHHPDRHANASETEKREQEKLFKELGEAYGILSDSKKKYRYDSGFDIEDTNGNGGFNSDPFQMFFGQNFQQQRYTFPDMGSSGFSFRFG